MPLVKTRIMVKTNGRQRALVTFRENTKGDLYIGMYSGLQVGVPPDNIKIKEHRYSLHVSERIPTDNLIKRTFILEDGSERNLYTYTNAVKTKSGFFCISLKRYSDLSASYYDVSENTSFKKINIGDFSPSHHTLIVGIFVGSPESLFPETSDTCLIFRVVSLLFQIIILVAWNQAPATPFAWFMDSVTMPSEEGMSDEEKQSLAKFMSGKSPTQCMKYFSDAVIYLTKNQLETFRDYMNTEKSTKAINGILREFPPNRFYMLNGSAEEGSMGLYQSVD
jgi:hypothetical protein